MLDPNLKRVRLHLVMDLVKDGTMHNAEMRMDGQKVLVYAAMTSAIVMFAKRHDVSPHDVSYSQTWEDM